MEPARIPSARGFVYAITPFNFSAIAGNLPTAPALMGNTVIWKPSSTQTVAAYWTIKLLEAAGMPPGVINLLTGSGQAVSEVLLSDPRLAGIHFTGSTRTFQHLWSEVGANIGKYAGYPRLVGETGGKDFVVAHASADEDVLRTALIRGAFEYQGQKCSAASRAYVPKSLWRRMRDTFTAEVDALTYGDVTDLENFGGASSTGAPTTRTSRPSNAPAARQASRSPSAASTTTASATSSVPPCSSRTTPTTRR